MILESGMSVFLAKKKPPPEHVAAAASRGETLGHENPA
jgi:hypothetical protein